MWRRATLRGAVPAFRHRLWSGCFEKSLGCGGSRAEPTRAPEPRMDPTHRSRPDENAPRSGCRRLSHRFATQPPPVSGYILKSLLDRLRPQGVAFIQIPTYIRDYHFAPIEYLDQAAKQTEMEMHPLKQSAIFEI